MYCTVGEVLEMIKDDMKNVIIGDEYIEDEQEREAKIATLCESAISDACAEIDGYLAKRYRVPFTKTPQVINKFAKDISVYNLVSRTGIDESDREKTFLNRLSHLETRGVLNSIAEGLRTSTVERFTEEKTPEGTSWKPSIRAQEEGGKTLTKTTQLKTSIRSEVSDSGLAVGTNDIRAATHQFGDERTIRAKNKKYLTFKIGGQWKRVASVKVSIPPRPFLGISEEDEQDIKDTLEEIFEE